MLQHRFLQLSLYNNINRWDYSSRILSRMVPSAVEKVQIYGAFSSTVTPYYIIAVAFYFRKEGVLQHTTTWPYYTAEQQLLIIDTFFFA